MGKTLEFCEVKNNFPQTPKKDDTVGKTPICSKRIRRAKNDDEHPHRPRKRKKGDIQQRQPRKSNPYEEYFQLKKKIEGRYKMLHNVIPEAPSCIDEYVTFNRTYLLNGNPFSKLCIPTITPPSSLSEPLKELFQQQEAERRKLRIQLNVERDKFTISNEQEVIRVHNRAARELAKQPLPFSVCTVLLHAEVCHDPEEVQPKYRKAYGRNHFSRRMVKTWLQDVKMKFSELKICLLKRQQNEALALNSIQKLHWQLEAQTLDPAAYEAFRDPKIQAFLVPAVEVTDFELTPV